MDTIFMSSGKSKTHNPHITLLNLTGKVDLKREDIHIALPNLGI